MSQLTKKDIEAILFVNYVKEYGIQVKNATNNKYKN